MSQLTTLFTDIADAIRSKNGESEQIPALSFPEKIESLETVQIEEGSAGVVCLEGGIKVKIDSTETFIADAGEDLETTKIYDGIYGKFVMDDDNNFYAPYDGKIKKITGNGELVWEASAISGLTSETLEDFTVDASQNVYTTSSRYVYKINSSGQREWSTYHTEHDYGSICTDGSTVYISSSRYEKYNSSGKKLGTGDSSSRVQKMVYKDRYLYSGGSQSGIVNKVLPYSLSEVWRVSGFETEVAPSNYTDIYDFCVSEDGRIYISGCIANCPMIAFINDDGNLEDYFIEPIAGSNALGFFEPIQTTPEGEIFTARTTRINDVYSYRFEKISSNFKVLRTLEENDVLCLIYKNGYIFFSKYSGSTIGIYKMKNPSTIIKGKATYTLPESSGGGYSNLIVLPTSRLEVAA